MSKRRRHQKIIMRLRMGHVVVERGEQGQRKRDNDANEGEPRADPLRVSENALSKNESCDQKGIS